MGAEMLRGLVAGRGLASVCSAHPLVIEAALIEARDHGEDVLIEATCNQVNQEGGYTGMDPASFREFVHAIGDRVGLARERIVLGGDHLGPNPWKHLGAQEALARAGDLVEAYARAGYEKLHLDASMGCAGEPAALDDATVAARAAALAGRAEQVAEPVYVIGTEVPTPGGATGALDEAEPTSAEAALATWEVHRAAFGSLPGAWSRVIATVVQPGVEFGHDAVAVYRPERARGLSACLAEMAGCVFEAHSTDYQPEGALRRLVLDGFAILKVGPALTFALREALYALDGMRAVLRPGAPSLPAVMEGLMLSSPDHWRSHTRGSEDEARVLRHFSYSDRIRYYWPAEEARRSVGALLDALEGVRIPDPLVSQYLPRLYDRVAGGAIECSPRILLLQAVRDVLGSYRRATGAMEASG